MVKAKAALSSHIKSCSNLYSQFQVTTDNRL